ncbi:hypothetical protein ACF0H5_007381 [Mactra antiquata]
MAGLLGAFKRLFSFKKSQEVPEVDSQSDENVKPKTDGDHIDPCTEVIADTEMVDMTSREDVKPASAINDVKVQTLTDSIISTGSDWEVLPSTIESRCHMEGSDVDSQFVDVQNPDSNEPVNVVDQVKIEKLDDQENIVPVKSDENKIKIEDKDVLENTNNNATCSSSTDVDDTTKSTKCLDNETDKTDKTSNAGSNKSGTKGQKICRFYNTKKGCTYRKCHFAHVKDSDLVERKDTNTDSRTTNYLHEKDFPDYLEFVKEMTKFKRLVMAKDLVYKLGYMKGADSTTIGDAITGQYKIAKSRHLTFYIDDIDKMRISTLTFNFDEELNLCEGNRKPNKNKKNKKSKKNSNQNENNELPLGICRDVRLKENPNLETVTANAAGDGRLIKKDIELGKRSTATGDGNNDSMLDTPSKRCKIAKLDVSRTPRSRPDQLAIGFNYHSDLVVKESPKTTNGEIIVDLDGETKPVLKSENGEILTPGGTVHSPLRQVCNQLAFGFNYHSDVVAKESPRMHKDGSRKKVNKEKKGVNLNDRYENKENVVSKSDNTLLPSSKLSECDNLAFGFSYNSDQLQIKIKNLDNKLTDDDKVSCLTDDAVIAEGRNLVEHVEDKPLTSLPAGSVW